MSELERWLERAKEDKELKKQLDSQSKEEREDAFSGNLAFGTGGMRGIMGAGTNRFNIYTIRKANYGFGKYLLKNFKSEVSRGVVISHDNRLNSRLFAFESAKVLGALGIKCFMFDDLRSTPELSFSVRYLNAIGGIMVTASHNPPKYNGYKIYDELGCQLVPRYADQVIEEVNKVDDIFNIPVQDKDLMIETGMLKILGSEVDDAFNEKAKSVLLFKDLEKKIKVVYTPLHGTGADAAKRILTEEGYEAFFVKEQMVHDPQFKTVKSPNPEDPKAFELAEALGRKNKAELLIATDPDADRVGIGVLNKEGKYVYLTGNQTGALLLYFRLSKEKELGILPKSGRVFNTIVTSDLGAKIAQSFGFKVTSTLTGFKFIGEQAKLLEDKPEEFIFGYEESYGYIIKDYVRDKDSIQSLIAIAEMANYYKVKEDRDLTQVLNEVYEKYGYYLEYTRSVVFEGAKGSEKMAEIMDFYRKNDAKSFAGINVAVKEDYELSSRLQYSTGVKSGLSLPKSNVIKFFLVNDGWVVLRPSGTEPKLKIYYSFKARSLEQAKEIIDSVDQEIKTQIEELSK
ncbi:MAG: phospho-sugar mutase [Gammaproteobacteria bacterium]|nr:phospho-sugar mutase [Gammaproteobacteria bacterium]